MRKGILWMVVMVSAATVGGEPIDRHAVVSRHDIMDVPLEVEIPLGNGEFCFNVDGTGLQTTRGNTMSHWGWHSFPLPDGFTEADVPETGTLQQGRNTPSGDQSFPPEKKPLRQWLFDNPHNANLARVRFVQPSGEAIPASRITNRHRTYDLWTGLHTATFELDGQPVRVETLVRMDDDTLVVRATSPLWRENKLQIVMDFPYPTLHTSPWSGDFEKKEPGQTQIRIDKSTQGIATVARHVDDLNYRIVVQSDSLLGTREDSLLLYGSQNTLTFSATFTKTEETSAWENAVNFDKNATETATAWEKFWKSGAAVDLSQSKDPRWKELERRIVLSQYLMRVNSAGSWPSAETGLMGVDGWRSQFHGEMIYWHLAHYALWNRWECADEALGCYRKFLPLSRKLAAQLGYKGAQWPKSTTYNGRTAPWSGNQVLLWKQPHPILFAELDYRLHPTRETLEKWAEIIDATAQYMADYPVPDENGIYHLTPVMPPSETGITTDTVFDLAYWRWGLKQANVWRTRMNLPENATWENVRKNLAPLPLLEGGEVYVHAAPENWHTTYVVRIWEHPDPVGILGMIPPVEGVDYETARRSTKKVFDTWDWKRVWGWDFPWTAMSACRTGQPEIAVEILLHESPRNAYDLRGVNANNPCPYLPGNGGVLYAIGMMAGGWDGCPDVDRSKGEAPGFPRNGQWFVRAEGFHPAP